MDTMALVREAMLGDLALSLDVDGRVWCPRPDKGWDAKRDGPAVSFFARGGREQNDVKEIEVVNVQVACWAVTSEAARSLYAKVRNRLHMLDQVQLTGGFLMSSLEVQPGQDIVDPDTNWNTVVTYFQMWFRAEDEGESTLNTSDQLVVENHVALGNGNAIDSVPGRDFAGVLPTRAVLSVVETDHTAAGELGIAVDVDWSPTADLPAADYENAAVWGSAKYNFDGQAREDAYVSAAGFVAESDGDTKGLDGLVGVTAYAVSKGAAPINYAIGVDAYVTNYEAHIPNFYGVSVTRNNGGHVDGAVGIGIGYGQGDGASCGILYGVVVEGHQDISGGTVDRTIGIDIQDQTIGSLSNHAIRTAKGLVDIGDDILVRGVFRGTVYSVAGTALPTAATAGMGARAFVSDATANTFNTAYAGGGSNKVPVFSDGTVWRIG